RLFRDVGSQETAWQSGLYGRLLSRIREQPDVSAGESPGADGPRARHTDPQVACARFGSQRFTGGGVDRLGHKGPAAHHTPGNSARMHPQVRDGSRLFQVELARPPIVPEAISHVGVLLYLEEDDACADGMYRVRGSEIGFAGPHGNPVQQLLDFSGAG